MSSSTLGPVDASFYQRCQDIVCVDRGRENHDQEKVSTDLSFEGVYSRYKAVVKDRYFALDHVKMIFFVSMLLLSFECFPFLEIC